MKQLLLIVLLSFFTIISDAQVMLQTVEIISDKSQPDTIYGIDISVYQGKIDYTKLDTNITFVIMKVSEGTNRVDMRFKYNWDNCTKIKGGYHFFRPQSSGTTQAKLFLTNLDLNESDIRPVIDVEWTPYWNLKKHRKIGVKNLKQMIEYIRDKTGVEPIIYTGGYFWRDFIAPYYDGVHTLWVADYRNKQPNTPHNMNWTIWQFTCKAKIDGIKTKVDKNICLNLEEILID